MSPENETRYGDAFCRELVEGMYREMLPLAWSGQKTRCEDRIHEMKRRADHAVTQIWPDADKLEFIGRYERMRVVISDVMDADGEERAAFIESLGIASLDPKPRRRRRRSTRMPLGELAVRTAVRATVWDAVRGIFRMFR